MDLYDKILNINGKDIELCIRNTIKSANEIITNTEGMCMVASNLIYNDLLDMHIPSKIINTKELGLGYEHEFVITRDRDVYYLIDITYNQFLNRGTFLNNELLNNGYIKVNNLLLVSYLNSIPNTYKIDNIDINNLFLSDTRKR